MVCWVFRFLDGMYKTEIFLHYKSTSSREDLVIILYTKVLGRGQNYGTFVINKVVGDKPMVYWMECNSSKPKVLCLNLI